jgi:CHASE2 domain-containing sensor protein
MAIPGALFRSLGEIGFGMYLLEVLKMLWIAAILVFLINLPFGYWRSQVRRFSLPWILAVHAPVPLVVACRFLLGLGWHLITFPVLIGAFFAGQLTGARLEKKGNRQKEAKSRKSP